MRIDFTRLLIVLLGFLVAQVLIQSFLITLGMSGLPLLITYNFLLAFVATLIYYPSGYRKDAFKNPEYYKNVAMFFLVFLLLSLIRI